MSYFTDLALQCINGQWRPGKGSWDIIDFNPYNGEKLASITVATRDEVDEAYRAAESAQREWAATNSYTRRRVFERAIRVIEESETAITEAIIAELGGTRLKAAFEIHMVKEFFREAVQLTLTPRAEILPSSVQGKENRVHRDPVGVVGIISPFNYPFLLAVKTAAPALALGNAVVLKPHQSTPICGGTLVAKVLEDAGLPPGLVNVVITDSAEIGDTLIEHPVPKVISFTGSDRVGRHVATVAGRNFKRVILQLGSNSGLVVLDDADVDYAVDAAVYSRFVNQGQLCMAANRIIVDRRLVPEFTPKFVDRVRRLVVGDPEDPATHIGPLINSRQAERVTAIVEQALAEGATALLHGSADGNLVSPSVLTDLPKGSPLLHEEIFGPVALVIPVDGEEEAVHVANDTPYGLAGAVHTADIERGIRVARRIDAGMVHVNDSTVADEPTVPYGGEKHSGLGRLNGPQAVEAFTTSRWLSIQRERSEFPF